MRETREARREEGADNHDRWLVSYADFITLLFAFFVVMYAISQVNEGKYRLLSDALIQAFKDGEPQHPKSSDPKSSDPGASAGDADAGMQALARDLINALDPLVKGGQVRVTESGLGIAIEIDASLLFSSADARLQDPAIPVLTELARRLAPLPNDVQIEGHTDNEPIATARFPSNWELSGARASSVVRLFIDEGVASVRLVAVGYADTRNIAPNTTPEGRVQNRRVTVLILPEKKRTPFQPGRSVQGGITPATPRADTAPQ
jgi:chemotaxis protein MotB